MEVTVYDFVDGGRYHYVNTNPAGDVFEFRGAFHAVKPSELIIQTFEWLGLPDLVSLETLPFEPLDGGTRTRITGHSVFPTVASRDGMVQNGMEHGVVEGYARLDTLLS